MFGRWNIPAPGTNLGRSAIFHNVAQGWIEASGFILHK